MLVKLDVRHEVLGEYAGTVFQFSQGHVRKIRLLWVYADTSLLKMLIYNVSLDHDMVLCAHHSSFPILLAIWKTVFPHWKPL